MDEQERRSAPAHSGVVARVLGRVEHTLNVAIAVALAAGGAALFVNIIVRFAREVPDKPFVEVALNLLDGLILVFIITELLHTLRWIIAEHILRTEPFLIVGIVAIVRRLIVISAEAGEAVGEEKFGNLMIEMGVLAAGLLVLGVVIYLLRRTRPPTSAPPEPEPEED